MAFTSDIRFIRNGDVGTLVFNVDLKEEYHVTKDKIYSMTVAGDKHGLIISYVNDIGLAATTVYDYMFAREGYESIRVGVPDEEFENRVDSLRESNAEVIHSKYLQEINSWEAYCDNVIVEAKKP